MTIFRVHYTEFGIMSIRYIGNFYFGVMGIRRNGIRRSGHEPFVSETTVFVWVVSPGGGTSYIWPTACAAPKGDLFSRSKVTVRVSHDSKSL